MVWQEHKAKICKINKEGPSDCIRID